MKYVQDILSGGRKFFQGGRSPPRSYGPGHQMNRYAEITLKTGLVYGYVFRKLLVRILLDILKYSLGGSVNSASEFH